MGRARIEKILINRNYARLWYGQAVSTLGDFVFGTTLVLWVATVLGRGQSWGPAAVSGIMLTTGAAVLLVGPAAGVFVDRWDRRRTMLLTEVVRAGAVGAMAAMSFLPAAALPAGVRLGLLYVMVFVVNAGGQFFNLARFAVLGEVVAGEADRARAVGMGQTTTATASVLGPPLAAPLLFTAGLQWALLLNAASYVFSWAAIRSLRLAGRQPQSPAGGPGVRAEFLSGLRYFAGNRLLMTVVTVAAISACGAGAITSLDVFFVIENLHADAHAFGYLEAAFGIGAVAGALASGAVVKRIGARSTLWGALVLAGLLVVGYARQTHFWSGALLLVAISVPIAMLNTAVAPLLLGATPSEYLGRVVAVINPVVQLASMVSVVVAGWLASTVLRGMHADVAGVVFGRIDTVFTASGICILLAGLYALTALRTTPAPATAPAAGPAPPAVHADAQPPAPTAAPDPAQP